MGYGQRISEAMEVKTSRAQIILDCLRKAVRPEGAGLTDGQLLRHYVTRRDEAAFAVLVRRHGSMVLALCRRMLRHAEDAEDAFQATFVILARKGHRIAGRQMIGGWLHGVAYRVALDVRRRAARRQAKEHQVKDMPHPPALPEEMSQDLLGVLDRELARLPDKYRLPVVLCELEGRSRKEAARQLGLPEGTLSSRLATARKTLARRMAGYGAAVTAASLGTLFASEAGAACVPASLLSSTVRAAGGVYPASVAALAEGVLKAMLLAKIKPTALVLVVVACLGVGGGALRYAAAGAEPGPKTNRPPAAARADKDDLETLRLEVEALRVSLQATRERVKTLETEVHDQKAVQALQLIQLTRNLRLLATELSRREPLPVAATAPVVADPPDVAPPLVAPRQDDAPPPPAPPIVVTPPAVTKYTPFVVGARPQDDKPSVKPTGETATAEANLRAAAAKVMLDPNNEQAFEAMLQAMEQMIRQAEPKPAKEPKN
jgi:RNA polymerase sigma factor (sigma-70 family)